MMNQYRNETDGKFGAFYLPLLVMAMGILVLLAQIVYGPPPLQKANADPIVEEVIDDTIAALIPEAEMCSALVLPVATEIDETQDNYQEDLYTFDGEREYITIPKINEKQASLLEYAYHVAKADGHKDPSVLQGLIWQESKAGGYPGFEVAGDEYGLRVGKRYYGVGQIKVAAAKDVFRKFPTEFPGFWQPPIREASANGSTRLVSNGKYLKTDEEIIAHLIMDDQFNIRVASKYLWLMGQSTKVGMYRPLNFAITAYNRGVGNTYGTDWDNWHYTVGVHKHKDTFIKEFNIANNIK